jgi:hypothetical protein
MRRVLIAFILFCGALVPAVVQGGSVAHAAGGNSLVLSCLAHGDLLQNSADFSTLGPVTYAGKKPGENDLPIPNPTNEPCSGNDAAMTGPIAKVAFKLTGSASCGSLWGDGTLNNFPAPMPMSGNITITYQNTNPTTMKPFFTKAFVALYPYPYPNLPDAVSVVGQVFAGVGQGASLSTDMLMQPLPTTDLDGSGKVEVPTETGGPTMDSYLTWFTPGNNSPCPQPGGEPNPPIIRWDTDGAGLLSLTGDQNAVLHSAFNIDYSPHPDPYGKIPIHSCDGFGKAKSDQNSLGNSKFGGGYNLNLSWGKGTKKPSPPTCDPTASLYSTTGTVTKETFTVSGTSPSACGDASSQPLNGKLTLTYTNIDPATLKPYYSSAYVSTEQIGADPFSDCWQLTDIPKCASAAIPNGDTTPPWLGGEAVCAHGIVAKGVGQGDDISGIILVHPVPTKDWDGNGTIDLPTADTVTMDSYLQYQNDLTAGGPVPEPFIWTTVGPGYGTLLGDPTAVLNNGFDIAPQPNPPI